MYAVLAIGRLIVMFAHHIHPIASLCMQSGGTSEVNMVRHTRKPFPGSYFHNSRGIACKTTQSLG